MRSTALPHLPRAPGADRPARLIVAVRARARATSLDRRLAAGAAPWQSPLLAARALQLTTERRRRTLARSLERLAESAERPAAPAISAAVPACRVQVREALAPILCAAARLRGAEAIDARGVARLLAVMSDGGGPVYVDTHPAALSDALQAACRELDVND